MSAEKLIRTSDVTGKPAVIETPEENKPFSKIYNKNKKELLLSDYSSLETKKLHAAAQIAQEGASKEIDEYLSKFSFPSEESKKLTKVALLNYCGAAILMPYKFFHTECKKLKYDLELLQNTFATSSFFLDHKKVFQQQCSQMYLCL